LADINHLIHMLESSKWRVLVEHGGGGEVISLAAFSPGMDVSQPHTPCSPSHAAEGMIERGFGSALDRVAAQQGLDGWQRIDTPGGDHLHMTDLWINAGSRQLNCHSPPEIAPRLLPEAPVAQQLSEAGVYQSPLYHHALRSSTGPRLLLPILPPGRAQTDAMAGQPGGLRIAWPSGQQTPLWTPRVPSTLPLRRGAPDGLWTLLHAIGLRELDQHLHLHWSDLARLLSTLVVTLVLIAQLGMALLHWADLLPLHVAVGCVACFLGSWGGLAIFMQMGHLHGLLASSGTCIVLPKPFPFDPHGQASQRLPPRRIGFGAPMGIEFEHQPSGSSDARSPWRSYRYGTGSRQESIHGIASNYASTARSTLRRVERRAPGSFESVTAASHDGVNIHTSRAASHDGGGAAGGGSAGDVLAAASEVVGTDLGVATPVGMTLAFKEVVRWRVRQTVLLTLLTAGGLYALDWYWLLVVRERVHDSSSSLSRGGDGALWLLGVRWGTALSPGAYIGWGFLSLLSDLALAGAYWVSLCCASCVLEAHVALAEQLNSALTDAPSSDAWAELLLLNVGATHGWLAQTSSRRLRLYVGLYTGSLAYVTLTGMASIAQDGAEPPIMVATVGALLALALLLSCFGDCNARRARLLLEAANERLEVQLFEDESHTFSQRQSAALAAHAVVSAELGALGQSQGHSLSILGFHVPPGAAMLWLAFAAAALGICCLAGLPER
jgi:hypothetical protein